MVRRIASVRCLGTILGLALTLGEGTFVMNAFATQPSISEVPANLEIMFLIHDYVRMPVSVLNRVEARAAKVLLEIGIQSQWETELQGCPDGRANPHIPVIDISVLPAQMASQLNLPGKPLGYSVLLPSGVASSRAAVFYSQALDMAKYGPASLDQLLAYAIAHELGHLLLGSAAHSNWGIMQANWGSPEVLTLISQGALYFDAQESAAMRAELADRGRVEATEQNSACAEAPTVLTYENKRQAF